MLTTSNILKTAALLTALNLSTGCNNTPVSGVAVSGSGEASVSGTAAPQNLKTGGPAATPKDSGDTDTPSGKFLLLVSGGSNISGLGMYTISTGAHDSNPVHFADYRNDYVDPTPLSVEGRAIAISKAQLSSSDYSLRLINFKTSQSYSLFASKTPLATPAVSPDTKWVAFVQFASERSDSGRIKLLEIATKTTVDVSGPISTSFSDSAPSFSPDGQLLIFERRTPSSSSIVLLPVSQGRLGSILQMTAAPDEDVSHFNFSKNSVGKISAGKPGRIDDSSLYSYLKTTSAGTSQLIVHTPGQPDTAVTDPNTNAFEPIWSPDGKSILFWSSSPDAQTIQIYNTTTRSFIDVVTFNSPRNETDAHVCPAWAPDMSEIYYTSSGRWDGIAKINLRTKTVTDLTDSAYATSYYCPKVMTNYEVKK